MNETLTNVVEEATKDVMENTLPMWKPVLGGFLGGTAFGLLLPKAIKWAKNKGSQVKKSLKKNSSIDVEAVKVTDEEVSE